MAQKHSLNNKIVDLRTVRDRTMDFARAAKQAGKPSVVQAAVGAAKEQQRELRKWVKFRTFLAKQQVSA